MVFKPLGIDGGSVYAYVVPVTCSVALDEIGDLQQKRSAERSQFITGLSDSGGANYIIRVDRHSPLHKSLLDLFAYLLCMLLDRGHVVGCFAATGLDECPCTAFALVHGSRVEADSGRLGLWDVLTGDVQGTDEEGIAVEGTGFKGFRHIGFPVKKV